MQMPNGSLTVLYDTGAYVCCICKAAFNQIPKHMQPPNLNLNTWAPKFRAANRDIMDTLGKYNLKFRIGERELIAIVR